MENLKNETKMVMRKQTNISKFLYITIYSYQTDVLTSPTELGI